MIRGLAYFCVVPMTITPNAKHSAKTKLRCYDVHTLCNWLRAKNTEPILRQTAASETHVSFSIHWATTMCLCVNYSWNPTTRGSICAQLPPRVHLPYLDRSFPSITIKREMSTGLVVGLLYAFFGFAQEGSPPTIPLTVGPFRGGLLFVNGHHIHHWMLFALLLPIVLYAEYTNIVTFSSVMIVHGLTYSDAFTT